MSVTHYFFLPGGLSTRVERGTFQGQEKSVGGQVNVPVEDEFVLILGIRINEILLVVMNGSSSGDLSMCTCVNMLESTFCIAG